MNALGLRFHSLTGNLKGWFAVSVSGNWRIVFGFSPHFSHIVGAPGL